MSGEAKLTKRVKELEGQLLELAAVSNNTIISGSFTGDGILKAANLMDICHKIYKDLAPPEEKSEGDEVKADRDEVSDAEVTEEKTASGE